MKSLSLVLCIIGSVFIVGCQSTSVIVPASKVAINYIQISQPNAKKMYRSKIIDVIESTERGEGTLMRMYQNWVRTAFSDERFKGAKSSDKGNDVAFMHGFTSDSGSMILTQIGEDAKIELYYIAPFTTSGLIETRHPEKYVLLIHNSSVCSASNVEHPSYNNGSWSFTATPKFSTVRCYGGDHGNIKGSVGWYYRQLKAGKPDYVYQRTITLEGSKVELEELASIIKAAFSNAN